MTRFRFLLATIVTLALSTASVGLLPSDPAFAVVGNSVVAWGDNDYGQTTVPPAAQSGVTQVAGGVRHSLALKSDGSVVAWGDDSEGQTAVPSGLSGVTQVSAGSFRSLALAGGAVVAWGLDPAVPVSAQGGVTQIAAGAFHSLALKSDGSVVAWGNNLYGQSTVPIGAQSGVIQVAAAGYHSLALNNDGGVVAWGDDTYGQSTVPTEAHSGVVRVAAGADHSIALKSDGSVVAWGQNFYGQTSVPDSVLSGVVQIAANGFHSLALKGDGTVVGWGLNDSGQTTVPAAASGGVLSVAAGYDYSLAVVAPRAVITFQQAPTTVGENAGVVNLRVTRAGNTATSASVQYARTSGSATPGADFLLPAGTLTFSPGETSHTIAVTVVNDGLMEPSETLVVALAGPGPGSTLGTQTAATVTITASDQQPDALISTRAAGSYLGNNVYNGSGAGQTKTLSGHRGQTRTFYVRVVNDGNSRNVFSIRGSAARAGSKVGYYSGAVNITGPVLSTTGWTVTLAPNVSRLLTVKVKIGLRAAFGSIKPATVRATWAGDVTRSDLVMARVRVVR